MTDILRTVGPLALAVVAALAVDARTTAAGLQPPRFLPEQGASPVAAALRRAAWMALLVMLFWVGVFAALAGLGADQQIDFSQVPAQQLFLMHALLASALLVWFVLGYVPGSRPGELGRQVGLVCRSPGVEIGLGVVAGVGIWAVVMVTLLLLSALIALLGGAEALPAEPPEMTLWMASLPVGLRVGVALSAGLFEEIFFRGYLQPRVGVGLSTVLFVLAHLSYQQPLMLVGVTILSLSFAALVRWRQSVWAAVVAHAVFDLVQLLVMLPLATRWLDSAAL